MTRVLLADGVVDPAQDLGRGQAVGPARVDPGIELVVDAGDADLEELVEVGDEDREEFQPLDQRQMLVLGELQHPVVEIQPRQLAVDEQLRISQVTARPRRLVGVGLVLGYVRHRA